MANGFLPISARLVSCLIRIVTERSIAGKECPVIERWHMETDHSIRSLNSLQLLSHLGDSGEIHPAAPVGENHLPGGDASR